MEKNSHAGKQSWISFEYALMIITMFASAVSFAMVLHYAVDRFMSPLPQDTVASITLWGNEYLLRTSLAGIILTFPLFAMFFIDIHRRLLKMPELRDLPGKKQVSYLILGITFLIILLHSFIFLTDFLSIDITARSVAHFAITIAVVGSIFGYFFYDVREDRNI